MIQGCPVIASSCFTLGDGNLQERNESENGAQEEPRATGVWLPLV